MANIIYARVMQKTATLDEWMSSDLVLLDGEQAFVVSSDGSPINFKIGDGAKTFSELPYWIQYDQAQYIAIDSNTLPTPSQDVGYSIVGSGTYTKAGQSDVVVPSGHMGILNWDGSVWYLGSSVEMPDNSAKIAEWEAGTYEQDEVVTVDGIIYRATEQTNEEPPSDKWEVIGGGSSDIDVDNVLVYNPSEIHIPSSQWIVGQSVNINTGGIINSPAISRTGKIYLKKGHRVSGLVQGAVGSSIFPLILDLDGGVIDAFMRVTGSDTEIYYVATQDCFVDVISSNNVGGDYYINIQLETVDVEGNSIRSLIKGVAFAKGSRFAQNGSIVNANDWAISDSVFGKSGSRVFGNVGRGIGGVNPKLVKFNADRTVVDVVDIVNGSFDFISDGDYFYRVDSRNVNIDLSFIEVHEKGNVLRGVENVGSKFGFSAKGQYKTNEFMGYSYQANTDTTSPLKLNVGDKLTAGIYSINSTTRPFFRFSRSKMFLSNNTEVQVTPEQLSIVELPSRNYQEYVTVSTRNDFGNDYFYEIERAKVHTKRECNAEFLEGYPYVGGSVVRFKSNLYRARELTFDSPNNLNVWECITGDTAIPKTDVVQAEIPNTLGILELDGPYPTDATPSRRKTLVEGNFLIDGEVKLNFKCWISVQGTSSAAHIKKGFAIDLLDFDNEKLKIAFGGGEFMGDPVTWTETDGFHLKAFHQDELMTRDVACMRLWRLFFLHMPYPSCWFSDSHVYDDDNSTPLELYGDRARFITDGFPFVLKFNGEYRGLYVWRQKKERANYRLDKDDKNHIWLEALGTTSMDVFDPSKWELRNPKLPGYDEGGPIDDTEVLSDINRFFTWVGGVLDGSIDFDSTYGDYIDINTFVYYIVFSELIYGTDGFRKNFQLFSYGDGIWKINPYDLDLTLGYTFTGVLKHPTAIRSGDNLLLGYLLNNKIELITSTYKSLRDDGVISIDTLFKIFRQIPAQIGTQELERNFDRWGSVPYDRDGHRSSLHWIMDYFKFRIDLLDGIWGYVNE